MSAQLVTIDPYSLLAGRKAELLRWLAEEGRFAPDTGRLLELLCDKLAALGIPIARATAGPVAELVGIEGGESPGCFNLELSHVGASDRRPRHEERYHEV